MAAADGTADRIAAAHARLLADRSLQFDFAELPTPKPPPHWVDLLFRVLQSAAPVMKYVFWGGLIAAVLLLAWFVGREIVRTRWPARAKPLALRTGVAPWRPGEGEARALLADADSLAAQGRFAEAAHLLLLRSIDDLRGRRPDEIRPALTSRDIAGLESLPDAARPAFRTIAQAVERSLFGGRPVDADGWRGCRAAYEDFALPKAWA